MTRSDTDYSYRVCDEDTLGRIHEIMTEQRLFGGSWPDRPAPDRKEFIEYLTRPGTLMIAGYIKNDPAGALVLRPFGENTLVAEIGIAAFRPYFPDARALFLRGLLFAMEILSPAPTAFTGKVARTNRHVFPMLASCGFRELGRLPGLVWNERLKKFVDGALVAATASDVILKAREV